MNELQTASKVVFLAPNDREPFTTSEVIAERAEVKHHAVQQMIQTYEKRLRSFGILAFEMRKPPEGSKGGRPKKVYHLNEQQATFLMTLLKNTDVVVAFKEELVRQFFAMRQELYRCQTIKTERRAIRRNVTDAIKALPETPHKKFKYAQYTNLAYMTAIGKTARAIREERGAKQTATASDFLTSAELAAVADVENRIGVMIDAGFDYQTIKAALAKRAALTA